MDVNLKSLVAKVNDLTRSSLEAAAGLCLSRTHYDVEIEHFLLKLLDQQASDLDQILTYFEVDRSRLAAELARTLDKLKTGNARTPTFSPHLVKMLAAAWNVGSLDYDATNLRSGFTIVALLGDEQLARIVRDFSRELPKIQPEMLRRNFLSVVERSRENAPAASAGATEQPASVSAPGSTKTPNLDQYTVNLTENAKLGKIDQVLGRDPEIRQIVDILMRRRQNNPILTGEAGVGKTAVVEGFALRVADGDVPPPLRNVAVRTLDLALLQAGAGIKGEFENRLKGLIEEVKKSPMPIILFVDEAHTMIGAGGQAGQNDAANLLKPALARGELRTIAATTWSEYKKYFEKDPALARRFQVVKVEEPSESQCMVMMRGIVGALEKHHNVRILDEGVSAAVRLSHRYLSGRQLPDKAVSVLDTACARLALGQNATPSAIEDFERQIADIELQERILRRESATGADHSERLESLVETKRALVDSANELRARWETSKSLVEQIRQLRSQLESEADGFESSGSPQITPDGKDRHLLQLPQHRGGTEAVSAAATLAATESDRAAMRRKLLELTDELGQVQGQAALMQVCLDAQIVGQVISGWTGIPLGKMVKDEMGLVLELERHLMRRVIGQDHALTLITQRIRTGRANLDDPGKPLGVFMLVGPSGVGKTETALALSDLLYGGEHNLITINMSEFQEAHTISTLKGSPPGYVGYGEGGVLTEAVRRRPYSVVLLDEVEKAHPDVLELFYRVFDKGLMEDGEGREIDFKNTIIILTTNACTDQLAAITTEEENAPSVDQVLSSIKPQLNDIFKPAFLGRLVIVPYYPLRDETLAQIVELKLAKIKRRMLENHKIEFQYGEDVMNEIAARCTEVESGARNVDNILTNTLLPDVSRLLLTAIAENTKLDSLRVTVGEDRSFQYSQG